MRLRMWDKGGVKLSSTKDYSRALEAKLRKKQNFSSVQETQNTSLRI